VPPGLAARGLGLIIFVAVIIDVIGAGSPKPPLTKWPGARCRRLRMLPKIKCKPAKQAFLSGRGLHGRKEFNVEYIDRHVSIMYNHSRERNLSHKVLRANRAKAGTQS
jgi:hypothetical protein